MHQLEQHRVPLPSAGARSHNQDLCRVDDRYLSGRFVDIHTLSLDGLSAQYRAVTLFCPFTVTAAHDGQSRLPRRLTLPLAQIARV